MLRQQKAAALEPESSPAIERALNYIKRKQIVERLAGGVAGLRPRLGGLITGSGFALGPEYYLRRMGYQEIRFRTGARASLRKYYLIDAEFDMPELAAGHLFVNLHAVHRRYPRIAYYGPGPGSSREGRSNYLLEDTAFRAIAGVQPVRGLRIGGVARHLTVNVGPGRDPRYVSTDKIFTELTTPGIQQQTIFFEGGGFIQGDWRDNPGGPRQGGNYVARYSSFSDMTIGRYSFSRADLEVQQYIPFFNRRRVIALRGRVQAARPHGGNQMPFYLQPTVGGSDDLRGFNQFRFYDNASAVFNAEYRWELFSGLDMALFADAGRVFPHWRQINLRQLERSYGFGFRANVRNDVFMRIDTGFSREGFHIWFKFNNVF